MSRELFCHSISDHLNINCWVDWCEYKVGFSFTTRATEHKLRTYIHLLVINIGIGLVSRWTPEEWANTRKHWKEQKEMADKEYKAYTAATGGEQKP